MNCKINRHASKVLKEMMASVEGTGKLIRVFVTQMHGDHAHYDLRLDTPTEYDEIVKTDKDIDILLDTRETYLDGVWIQYFYVPKEEFVITNPVLDRSHHGHHH
ncbi:MAG TPA: iron-sulfur cluster assembly accessory protein [Bacillus sp. (in: firmicutes)]|jgi:Fe-S cluster assembly iron-binding protein IscA